jgi:hypothetical protein
MIAPLQKRRCFWIAGYTDYLRDVVGAADTTQLRYLRMAR